MVYAAMARSSRVPVDKQMFAERFKKSLMRSRELTGPGNEKCIELQAQASLLLMQMGDAVGAQSLLEKLLAENPNEPAIRLNYAPAVRGSYEGRVKAIQWLDKPLDRGRMGTRSAALARDYESQMRVDATGLRMEQYVTEKDERKKPHLMTEIEAGVSQVERE